MALSAGVLASLAGGFVGGTIGAIAQIWVSRKNAQRTRLEAAHRAAADILDDLFFALRELAGLQFTPSPSGSPYSYRDRAAKAQPILDRMHHSVFVSATTLTETELRRRLRAFRECCEYVASSKVDAADLGRVLEKEVAPYGRHVRDCLQVYLDGERTGWWPRRRYNFPDEPSTASIEKT